MFPANAIQLVIRHSNPTNVIIHHSPSLGTTCPAPVAIYKREPRACVFYGTERKEKEKDSRY